MLYYSRWKSIFIWLVIAVSVIIALPNAISDKTLSGLPSWFPKHKITLGLDLQGGSHVMLQVDRNDIVKERLQSTVDDVRTKLREANVGYTGLAGTGQTVQVRIRDVGQLDAAKKALSTLTQPISAGTITGGSVVEATLTDAGDGLLKLTITDQGIEYRMTSAVTQSTEVIRRRVDELGTTEPTIQREGADRIIVQVPGLQDPQRLKNILNQTAKLSFHMVDQTMSAQDALNGRAPATSEVMYSNDDPPVPYLIEKRSLVSGEDLVDAQASFNSQTNEPVVTFRFDSKGATRFAQATSENVGKPFAIVLDNDVLSAPVIREPILGGSGQISGSFSVQSANDLAVLLRAGALPAKLTVVEERTVGPGLGADSIKSGVIAGALGSVLVIVFMMVFYGLLGFIANVAVTLNVIMILAILTMLGATLTLPGIAGIVLTIGVAVDANVLVYERIREDFKNGKSFLPAVESGFTRAFATIVDANVTHFIAAAVLFFLGSGPIRGFAITLMIGIVTTVFTAYTLTRWLVAIWVRRARPKAVPKGVRTGFFDGSNIRFMRLRNFNFGLSAMLSVASVVGFMTLGMNLGIDFTGGSIFQVKSIQGEANLENLRTRLSGLNLGEVMVQGFGSPSEALIRVQAQNRGENAEQSVDSLVRGELEKDYSFSRVEVVGPTVSGELAKTGTIGVTVALIGILLYVWLRFEWQFAVGAIIATVHDVLLTIGMFVITGTEFNVSSIAAVLTIVGYSLNDTVVIYDRVRETMRRYKKMPMSLIIDTSTNQTMSRTIMTSITTSLAILALVIFGGEVIRSFTIAMLFGVIVGTYSSIYIAAPILILFKLRSDDGANSKDDEEDAALPAGAK
ncbi:SecD/SecF fusion protein [Rhizobium aquaticum]|uniref:Multifunctional fusion protein n=1 Tax=Rhizobium aquaticum TaxID=1549636 RepID=A0ABV2IVM9_9HYPH